MHRRSALKASLTLERLEEREVPAIVLDGTFTGSTVDGSFRVIANGGGGRHQ